jgi:RNA polymerase sigma factor (sigma-70 family)
MTVQVPDDDVLATRCRDGDPAALATLYRRHATPLLAHLVRVLGARAEAEDVLHETFLRLFEGRGTYRGRGRFRAWLFTVATHLAFDRLRRQRRHDALAHLAADVLSGASRDPSQEAERRELAEHVEAALADLSPEHALAFHLRVREAFTYREIAGMCGAPEGTLRSRVHHALARIRRTLDQRSPRADRSPDPGDRPADLGHRPAEWPPGRREESP